MNYKLKLIMSIPKSLWVNCHYFPLKDAIKLPLLISFNTRIGKLSPRARVKVECPLERGLFKFGFDGIESLNENKKQYFSMLDDGVLILKGHSIFAEGVAFTIGGTVVIGDHVCANNNFRISCRSRIDIGNDVLIGWNVNMLDADNHTIHYLDGETNAPSPIIIGNKVWIGALSKFLKGSGISDNCVVAYNSLITKRFNDSNCIIGGAPAKVIKEIRSWEK